MLNASLGCLFWALQINKSCFAAMLLICNLWIAFKVVLNLLNRSLSIIFHLLLLTMLCLTSCYSDCSTETGSFSHGLFSVPVAAVMLLTLLLFDLLQLEPEN